MLEASFKITEPAHGCIRNYYCIVLYSCLMFTQKVNVKELHVCTRRVKIDLHWWLKNRHIGIYLDLKSGCSKRRTISQKKSFPLKRTIVYA